MPRFTGKNNWEIYWCIVSDKLHFWGINGGYWCIYKQIDKHINILNVFVMTWDSHPSHPPLLENFIKANIIQNPSLKEE